jgi:uncharacterized membrane protein
MVCAERFFYVVDANQLDDVDLRSVGSVRIYVNHLGSVCSHVWIACGLLTQLLYSTCLLGIPVYLLRVSIVVLCCVVTLLLFRQRSKRENTKYYLLILRLFSDTVSASEVTLH